MNKVLVALALLALPVVAAPGVMVTQSFAATTVSELGDLSQLTAIASDTLALVAKGDMALAAKRITDFEAAWDADASKLRALSKDKWGLIDSASDSAIASLRTSQPSQVDATATVTALVAALENPSAQPVTATATATTAVTDANGRPVPCEELLGQVRSAAPPSEANKSQFDELQAKGIERCNADDDKRADGFFAQALALAGN